MQAYSIVFQTDLCNIQINKIYNSIDKAGLQRNTSI